MEDLGSLLLRVQFLFLFNAIEALYEKKKKENSEWSDNV